MRPVSLPPWTLLESRAGAGTPVVLVHGLSGSSRWWARNIDALASRHLVAAIDLIGFGRNRRFLGVPRVLPRFGEVTALLARYLETFGEPVHLIGHSMGGQIATRLAAERPDLLRSLVLVNATGLPFALDPRPHVRALPHAPLSPSDVTRVLLPDALRAGPTSVAVATLRVFRGDMRAWMTAVQTPALLVWGENDPLVPLAYGQEMARLIPGARLVVLPHAGHVAMWESAERFNEETLRFLDEVEAQPPPPLREGVFTWGLSGFTEGMAYRQSGRRRDVVLVHGLGLSSRYLARFARALYDRGWNPVAPDLPGFGESANAPAMSPREQAAALERWADALSIRDAVWIGHSVGCNAVAHLRDDLVKRRLFIGPLWTRRPWRAFAMLALDAFREPLSLFRHVLAAYWRAGLWRWWRTWRKCVPDLADPPAGEMLAGVRDPLPDRAFLAVRDLPGAHACVYSDAEACAGTVSSPRSPAGG